ncbi:MAG: AIR carboxylase family protein, partial [Candidatus Bathyarchaeia archaeon]
MRLPEIITLAETPGPWIQGGEIFKIVRSVYHHMGRAKIVVIMGSEHDMEFASKIKSFLDGEGFTVECEFKICSAHRNTHKLLQLIQGYEGQPLVYVTVAGLSDSLSGVVAGNSSQPVI